MKFYVRQSGRHVEFTSNEVTPVTQYPNRVIRFRVSPTNDSEAYSQTGPTACSLGKRFKTATKNLISREHRKLQISIASITIADHGVAIAVECQ